VYRKRVLNQLINGILINAEVAGEESKLDINIGTIVVRVLTLAYSEIGQGKNSNLNSFLLTFQSLMPQYPDLLGLIDLLEETATSNARFLRLLRDLFSANSEKRQFSS
jgi:hypothetical protein